MKDTKLTDFTSDELRCMHVTIGMYFEMCKQVGHEISVKDREILQLWQVQLMNAASHKAFEDKILSN